MDENTMLNLSVYATLMVLLVYWTLTLTLK